MTLIEIEWGKENLKMFNHEGLPTHEKIERRVYQISWEHGFHPGNALNCEIALWFAKIQDGCGIASLSSVGNFVTAKASEFNRLQQAGCKRFNRNHLESTRFPRV
jgi:hypothetical protein